MHLYSGKLGRFSRDANGTHVNAPPPDGFPDGHMTQVMKDEAGDPANLVGRATGAVIEVLVDHDEGTLGFRVNGGPPLDALKGFPKGAALRISVILSWAFDRVSLVQPYL